MKYFLTVNFERIIEHLRSSTTLPIDYKKLLRLTNDIVDRYDRVTGNRLNLINLEVLENLLTSTMTNAFELSPFSFRNFYIIASLQAELSELLNTNIKNGIEKVQEAEHHQNKGIIEEKQFVLRIAVHQPE